MPVAARTPVDDAVLAMLRAVLARPVGDAEIPRTVDDQPEAEPYGILWPIEASIEGAALVDMHVDGKWSYQFTSVGLTRKQVGLLSGRLYVALFDESASGAYVNAIVPAAGQKVIGREFASTSGIDVEGRNFQIADRFTIWTTPS